jgi:hypothetical protein
VGLIIDSTLNMQYYGGYKAALQGYYYGKVTPGFWDTLNIQLRQINFKKLDTAYRSLPIDGEPLEAIFIGDRIKGMYLCQSMVIQPRLQACLHGL